MAAHELRDTQSPALSAIGLDDQEESAYLTLLDRPGQTGEQLAQLLGLPTERVQTILDTLEGRGLLRRAEDHDRRYLPSPPDVAVGALIMTRQAELQQAQLGLPALLERARNGASHSGPMEENLEIIAGREAVNRVFDDLQRSAAEEILVFDRPPYARGSGPNNEELAALRRGVRCRAVYDASALDRSGALEHLRDHVAAGEEARATSGVPIKLVLVDHAMGLIPVDLRGPDIDGALLVRTSSLLSALRVLFDTLWSGATPLFPEIAAPVEETDRLPESQWLVPLLAAGMKDHAIARRVGVSKRTLDRRVHALMRELGAETRFQAGYRAALRRTDRSD